MDNKVTRFLFWAAFVAFLGSSIPHVAWVFNQFEQGNMQGAIGLLGLHFDGWYGLSMLIATSIDAQVAWLSYQLAIGKGKANAAIIWTFILCLSALSWYCNWIYAIAHSPAAHINAWAIPLFFGLTTTGTFTSWIVSAYPVFSIGYTFMLSKMNESLIDPGAFEDQLKAKKKIADLRKQYAPENGLVMSFVKTGIRNAADIGTFAKQTIVGQQPEPQRAQVVPVLDVQKTEIQTDMSMDVQTDITEGGLEEVLSDTPPLSPVPIKPRKKQLYISVEDAILATGYNGDYLRKKIRDGAIQCKVGSKDVLLISSLNAYLIKNRKLPIELERNTDEIDVSLLQEDSPDSDTLEPKNGQKNITQPLAELAELEV